MIAKLGYPPSVNSDFVSTSPLSGVVVDGVYIGDLLASDSEEEQPSTYHNEQKVKMMDLALPEIMAEKNELVCDILLKIKLQLA